MSKTVNGMTFELKNVKHAAFNSHDSECFEATLYIDGKRVARVSDDGWGGMMNVEWFDKTFDQKALDERIDEGQQGEWYRNTYLALTLEHICSDLIGDYLNRRGLKRALKSHIVQAAPGKVATFHRWGRRQRAFKGKTLDECIAMVRKSEHDVFLNGMPEEEALEYWTGVRVAFGNVEEDA